MLAHIKLEKDAVEMRMKGMTKQNIMKKLRISGHRLNHILDKNNINKNFKPGRK